MRLTPAFMVLEEFEAFAEPQSAVARGLSESAPQRAVKPVAVLTEADLKRAHEEGWEAGYSSARTEFEVLLSKKDEEHRANLEAAQREFSEQWGTRLAEDFTAAINDVREELAREAAQSVLPFLDNSLRQKALDDLNHTLLQFSRDASHTELNVKGPAELVDTLQRQLPEGWLVNATVDENDPEVTVQMDASVFRTQITEWIERVQEAAG